MGNIWDLPEQHHPIHGKKRKNVEHHEHEESDIGDSTNRLMKTTSDFMLGAAGITVMAGMGGALIGALKPK